MCLPGSFPLSISQINTELGRNAGDPFDMLGVNEMALAGVSGAPNSMSNFLGKCSSGVSESYSNFSGGTSWNSVPVGASLSFRRLYIAIIHGFVSSSPGANPTLTVNGNAATKLGSNTTGGPSTPATVATGAAWFSYNLTSGTTANFAASWGGMTNLGIIVCPAFNYTTFQGYEGDGGSTGGSDGQVGGSLNTVNGGAILAVSTYSSHQTVTWSQLTAKDSWTLGWTGSTGNSGGLGMLANITASSIWNVSPHPGGDGNYMSAWISLAP